MTVMGNGNEATVTGVSAGYATVTYKVVETQIETFIVHVVDRPKISIDGDLVVGGKTRLSVNFKNTDPVQWASDNTKVATIDSDGVVEGISVGKANITAFAGSESATKQIEVKRDESKGGYYVYLYTKVVGNTKDLALTVNGNGWYTVGRVWVEGITNPAQGSSTSYDTSSNDYNKVISALKDPSNVDLYGVNNINLEDIEWSVEGQPTGLKTASGAVDYDTSNKSTWHLDGYVDLDKVGFGSVVFHYVDALNPLITIAKDESVTAKVTGKEFDFSKYIISIEGYTYDHANPLSVKVDKNSTKEVTLYYNRLSKRQIEMQAKSDKAPYDGREHSVSGFESDVFEFDGVKYTVAGLAASAAGTGAGTYKTSVSGTAKVTDPEGNDVTAQFDVTAAEGELVVAKRVLTLTSASGEKPYDGNPLVRNSQADVAVTGDGFAEGEGAVYDITGSQTQAGSSKNGFTYELKGNTKAENYQIAKAEGDLTVKPVEAKVTVTVKGSTGTKPYNGAEQSVEGYSFVSADNPLYAEADVGFSGDAVAKGTDAGKYPMGLEASQFSNVNKNFANVEFVVEDGSIVIDPATLTVTTPNATRVYNGQPLTAAGAIEGFVNGETADFATTGSQTAVGTSDNTYAIDWEVGATAKESNYMIAENTGTLTVTAQSIVPDPQNPESYLGVVVDSPSDHVYDSLEHKWVPTVTDKDGNALVAGTEYEVTYSTTDFTNVTGDIVVTITGKGNYSGEVVRNYKITPAPLTVNAKNASRAYNGQPLTAPGTISGLVNGETAEAVTEGSQTEVGSSVNDVKGVSWGTAKEGNYYISAMNDGLLTITPKSVASMTVGKLPDVVYSGTSQVQKPAVNDGDKLLIEGADYDLTFSADTTNVGVVTVIVTGKGNYAGSVDVSYRIKPAALTVTTPSASRVYNGQPLTAAGTIEGFVNGETAGFATTGSQTAVGTSDNTYAIDWAASTTAKKSNYTIVEKLGKLTVTEFADEIVATPGIYKGVYDGNPHGVDVAVTGLPEGYTVKTASSNATATDVTDEAGVTATVDDLVIVNAQGEDVTNKLKVTKKTGAITVMTAILMVATPSASMQYDGTALTAEGSITGFVNGETAGFTTTGSQTAVGTSDNTYAIDWEAADATAKQSNYTIVEKLGTLKVTPNTTSIVVTPKGGTKVYDGIPLESSGVDEIVGLPKGFTLTAEIVGSVTDAGYAKASIKSFAITNVAGGDVTDQFANVATGEATLVVTPRPVTVASADATKVYDGTELVKHEAKVSDGELVEGEEFDYEFFGTQTDAGVSDNTFAVKPGNDATKLENYEITYDRGALTVAPAPYSVTTESATKVYDGTALTAGGKIEGLLEGETANLKVTGSQTKVGASENTYTIEWTGTAKESNYKLESESIGTLTVTAAPDSPTPDDQSKDQGVFNGNGAGLVQTGDVTGIYGIAAIIAAAVAAFVSLLAVRRRKE